MLYQGVAPCEKREEIVELFDRLVQVDSCRKGYYLDKRSKFITSVALFQQLSLQPCPRELDLSNKVSLLDPLALHVLTLLSYFVNNRVLLVCITQNSWYL